VSSRFDSSALRGDDEGVAFRSLSAVAGGETDLACRDMLREVIALVNPKP